MAMPAILLALAYVLLPRLAELGGSVVNVYNVSAVLSAASVCAAVVVRRPRPMGPWLLIAGAVLLWVLGDVSYGWLGTTTSGSFPDLRIPAATVSVAVLALAVATLLPTSRASAAHQPLAQPRPRCPSLSRFSVAREAECGRD